MRLFIYNVTIIKISPDKSFRYSEKCDFWDETLAFAKKKTYGFICFAKY